MDIRAGPYGETPGADTAAHRPMMVRGLTPRDRLQVAGLLSRISDTTWRLRYLSPRPQSAEALAAETDRIAGGDPLQHVVLLAVAPSDRGEQVVAIGELVCDRLGRSGELAIVVSDEQQRRGIGRVLVRRLVGEARDRGLVTVRIDTLVENRGMLALVRGLGARLTVDRAWGEVSVVVELSGLPPVEGRWEETQKSLMVRLEV